MSPCTGVPAHGAQRQPPRLGRALLGWTLLVLLLHALALEGLLQATAQGPLLRSLAEPAFDRPLMPDTATATGPQAEATPVSEPTPTATFGQVVQARTLPALADGQRARPKPSQRAPKKQAAAQPQEAAAPLLPAPPPETSDPPVTAATEPQPPHAVSPTSEPPVLGMDGAHSARSSTEAAQPSPADATAASAPNTPALAALDAGAERPATADSGDAHWPRNTRLSYELTGHFRGPLTGDARVQWQRDNGRYQAQVAVHVGLIFGMQMTSQGRITPLRLWPEVYAETRRGKTRSVQMGDQLVVLDQGQNLPRPPGLQDTASQFVQLAQDFERQRQPLVIGHAVPVVLARPGGVDEWWYDVVALEPVDTALGTLPAYHLKPRPLANPRGTVTAEMWFAPSLQHLPVRIRLSLNPETWLDLRLSAVAQSQ